MEIAAKAKRKRGIETTQKILEAAAELFAHKGFDAVPMSEIAKAVGIKESSLYNHFAGKAAIRDALFDIFVHGAPECRPSDRDIDAMLEIMQPEEIFKNILFYFGSHVSALLKNTAMIINNEKYKDQKAALMYYGHVVNEAADYYERLIRKMMDRNMVKKVDARLFAEQYNYISIALTKEYFMADNGLADVHSVVKYMIKTIDFFCAMMKP